MFLLSSPLKWFPYHSTVILDLHQSRPDQTQSFSHTHLQASLPQMGGEQGDRNEGILLSRELLLLAWIGLTLLHQLLLMAPEMSGSAAGHHGAEGMAFLHSLESF